MAEKFNEFFKPSLHPWLPQDFLNDVIDCACCDQFSVDVSASELSLIHQCNSQNLLPGVICRALGRFVLRRCFRVYWKTQRLLPGLLTPDHGV